MSTWLLQRVLKVLNPGTEASLASLISRLKNWRKTRSQEQAAAAMQAERTAQIAKLSADRVGSRFLRREDPDSEGVVGLVVSLATDDPTNGVEIVWAKAPGLDPDPGDRALTNRIRMSWTDLTKPSHVQQHETARLIAKSDDDQDGWVMFEPLDRTAE